VVLCVTWVSDDGDTMTYTADRGNAHTVEGMVFDLTMAQDQSVEDEFEDEED
jgi:hypothetical protein